MALRVCVGEDNEDYRHLVKSLLKALGHEVVCDARDGQELIISAQQNNVDIVIVDLEMPVLDGLAAAERIAETLHVPIILLSGHEDVERVVIKYEPVSLILKKPISLGTLREAIAQAMKRNIAT